VCGCVAAQGIGPKHFKPGK